MSDIGTLLKESALTERQRARLTFEAEKLLCKSDLFYLAKNVLGYKDITEAYHKPIADTLRKYDNSWQFHLHPRGHFKSTLITVSETVQELLNNPNETILITNAVLGNSISFLKEIKSHFIQNEKFRSLFPEYCPKSTAEEGNQESFTTPARTNTWLREASVEVSGIDKSIVSRHYGKIVFDDIVNNINVSNPEQRLKIVNAFKNYLSLLNPGGKIRVIGTRWHYYDLYGYILEEIRKDRKNHKDPKFKMFVTSAYVDDDLTEPAFPERFTSGILQDLKETQGPYIFSCQYLNNPQPDEEKIFSRKDIRFIPEPIVEAGTNLFYFCSTDPSVSEGERSDPAVIITIAVNSEKQIFITDITRDWYNPDSFIDAVLNTAQRVLPLKFGFEAVSFQKVLKYFLEKEKTKRGIHMNIVEMKRSSHASKAERIKRIQPFLKAGQIFLCCDEKNLTDSQEEFLDELDTFPYGRYDDILDALADAVEIHTAPSKRIKQSIKYERTGFSQYGTGYHYRLVPSGSDRHNPRTDRNPEILRRVLR